jgi:hypothetical protein
MLTEQLKEEYDKNYNKNYNEDFNNQVHNINSTKIQNRKSIKLFGHKYYVRPKALQVYRVIGDILSALLVMASMCIWYCIFWVMMN